MSESAGAVVFSAAERAAVRAAYEALTRVGNATAAADGSGGGDVTPDGWDGVLDRAHHDLGLLMLKFRLDVEQESSERVCSNERAHWRHSWLGQACPGRVAVTAAFADHRFVDVMRCYQSDGKGVCRRMLVMEQPDGFADPGEGSRGWVLRQWGGAAAGVGEREWRCPVHSAG